MMSLRAKSSRGGSSKCAFVPPHRSTHLMQKLFLRETFGKIRTMKRPAKREVISSKVFSSLPARLALCLKEVVPLSALESGHVFLGLTTCGQFLLSYTQTSGDVIDLGGDINLKYTYRLHWWLFVPGKRAKKVAEILLFSDQGSTGQLHISFCQWQNDMTKVVVYGYFVGGSSSGGGAGGAFGADGEGLSRHCYLTITAVPSLHGCKDCSKVAASYEEDDVAEAWNSCMRLSCLTHGMTVHTNFDLVHPFPTFEPKINLKRKGYIVINTGNLFHSLHVELEKMEDIEESQPLRDENLGKEPYLVIRSPKATLSELDIGTTELSLSVFSPPPPMVPPSLSSPCSNLYLTSDSEATDCESETYFAKGRKSSRKKRISDERKEKVNEFVEMLHRQQVSPKHVSSSSRHIIVTRRRSLLAANRNGKEHGLVHNGEDFRRKRMAEKAYELTDDDFEDGVKTEKLSTFRKKRLAEKTYEFKEEEEDSENMTPLPRLRSGKARRELSVTTSALSTEPPLCSTSLFSVSKSPRYSALESEDYVLKPINVNSSNETANKSFQDPLTDLVVDSLPVPELLSPGGMVKKDSQPENNINSNNSGAFSPRSNSSISNQFEKTQSQPPLQQNKIHAKFTRRFVELDDEMISVITDIEDEEDFLQTNNSQQAHYHTALPLEVHGSGYQSLSMISNSKAERLTGLCIRVSQRTLDFEVFCHQMAQRLCHAAEKKYWFCNNYDVELVDVDPESGDVIAAAVVLVKATTITKRVTKVSSISSLQRHQYQGSFRFVWNMDTAECALIDSEPLKEVSAFPDGDWHPARAISYDLQRQFGVFAGSKVKSFTNGPVLSGVSLKTIFDPDNLVAIIQDNLDTN